MGLDTTHDCWHGAYSAFMRWRKMLAAAAGLPPLLLMDGFYVGTTDDRSMGMQTIFTDSRTDPLTKSSIESLEADLPISWDCLKPNPLHELLFHSDCEGDIPWQSCAGIADSLEQLLPELSEHGDVGGHIGNVVEKTEKFIAGLRDAASKQENVEFH